jgi:FMN phosphatase YigB (HAD superfamily)
VYVASTTDARCSTPSAPPTTNFKSTFRQATVVAVSFDLFGTLVDVDRPSDPAAAVARELTARGVPVPADWASAYRERHVDAPPGAEVPLPAHVAAALASRGIDAPGNAARRAVVAAFDPAVERRPGARAAIEGVRERGLGPVGLLSNCAVPELVARTLLRAGLRDAFDATVASVGCGWRKPDRRAFAAVARGLDVPLAELVHVGDDPRTDGGAVDAGGRFVDVGEVPLDDVPAVLARPDAEGDP